MKFTILKNEITDVLARIQGIAGRKTNMAITENVLIRTSENGVIISATDLETGFEGFYPAVVEDHGEAAVNARKLHDIVKMFPTDQLMVEEQDNQWIKIYSESVEYHLVGMDTEDFPDIPKVADAQFFFVNSEAFRRMIEKSIAISVGGEEKREHMTGVQMEKIAKDSENILRMVSTDIKRLSKIDTICAPDSGFFPGEPVILPKKGLAEVNKFLEFEGNIQIGVQGNHFIVKKDNETVIINLLEGDFPRYQDLLNIDASYDVAFNRDLLMMMLKRMTIITSEEYRSVIFYFDNHALVTRAANPNVGESKEKLAIDYDREPIEVAFNPKYFIEALNFIETDQVLLNIRNNESPCIVHADNSSNYLNIIMPMKI